MVYYAWAIVSGGFCYETLVRFYTETCWVHCNTKSLINQGCRVKQQNSNTSKFGNSLIFTKNWLKSKLLQLCRFIHRKTILHKLAVKLWKPEGKIQGVQKNQL